MQVLRGLERHPQPPDWAFVERSMSVISKISSSRPSAATPAISRAAKVNDTDMAGSLAVGVFVTGDLDQPALHDRAGGDVGPATSDGPAVEGGPSLGIANAFIECSCPRIVVLHQHPRQRSTMIDDLLLQCRDQLGTGTQGLQPLVHGEHPDGAGICCFTETTTT